MKTLLKAFTCISIFGFVACGGNECQTCTNAAEMTTEICDDDASITDSLTYEMLIANAVSMGYTCE